MIGDYCMRIEPADSYSVSGMVSSGWLTIADWRIALSNIGGMVDAVFYMAAALIPWSFNGFFSGFESFGWIEKRNVSKLT